MDEEVIDLNARVIRELEVIPDNIGTLPLLQMAYRGKVELTPQQMRAAIEALPFEVPKLTATANVSIDGTKSFAEALERCIARSQSPPQLNGNQVEQLPASELKQPMTRYRRF